MKPQKQYQKDTKIKCSWEKYAPSYQKRVKKCALPYFLYIKKNIFPLFNYKKNKIKWFWTTKQIFFELIPVPSCIWYQFYLFIFLTSTIPLTYNTSSTFIFELIPGCSNEPNVSLLPVLPLFWVHNRNSPDGANFELIPYLLTYNTSSSFIHMNNNGFHLYLSWG